MTEPESSYLPCPYCNEQIMTEARVCPHCRASVLFDVHIEVSLSDGRTQYHISRELERLDGVSTEFLVIKQRLQSAPGPIITGVTRATAERCVATLQGHALKTGPLHLMAPSSASRPHAGGSRPAGAGPQVLFRHPVLLIAAGASVVVTLALLVLLLQRTLSIEEEISPLSQRQLVEIVEISAVEIRCNDQLGAGFFVEPNLVVSNAHVVCGDDEELQIALCNGKVLQGRVERRDAWLDLALVRTSAAVGTPIPLGDATRLHRGDPVLVMGNPHGLDFTLAKGMISHPSRPIRGVSYLQIDATIHPGNSGGPILDTNGLAVGIVTMMVGDSSSIGLALPVNYLVSGRNALLDSAEIELDITAWSAYLREANKADREEVARFKAEMQKPMVLRASILPPGRLIAVIGLASASKPTYGQLLSFDLSKDGARLCAPSGIVEDWQKVSMQPGELDSRYLLWLEKHSLARDMYVTAVHLRMMGCPGPETVVGATLALEGSELDRAVVRYGTSGLLHSRRSFDEIIN
jgi:serine protease Do